MVETQYLLPNKEDQAVIRFSQVNNRLIDDDDTDEGFQSAFASEQRLIA